MSKRGDFELVCDVKEAVGIIWGIAKDDLPGLIAEFEKISFQK
jgi:hypothetical protein